MPAHSQTAAFRQWAIAGRKSWPCVFACLFGAPPAKQGFEVKCWRSRLCGLLCLICGILCRLSHLHKESALAAASSQREYGMYLTWCSWQSMRWVVRGRLIQWGHEGEGGATDLLPRTPRG